MSSTDTKDKSLTDYRYKHPVFDGENPKEFKDWWDNVFATLEMDDIEEYVTDAWSSVPMPSKLATEYDDDEADKKVIYLAKKNKIIRKEMKKAKAHMVKVTKEYPKRLIMEADTPYEARMALKNKYSFAKNRHDFTSLDKEWNEFKIKDAATDLDKIFAILDEHSKKLSEFGSRYEKDALQILSKLEVAMSDGYEHIFTLLNTDEEHKKSADVQLVTAKRMIKAHYDTTIASDKKGKAEGSMMCMFVSNEKSEKTYTKYKCDHCGKTGHTAYRDGKPFCRDLIAKLIGGGKGAGNKSGGDGKFKGKCYNCNKYGNR